jgi:hypothetical protein
VKERVRPIKRNETRAPRDLAKRFAEVLALRELVRIRESNVSSGRWPRTNTGRLGGQQRKKTSRLLRRPPA